ncbi:hypothetical protein, partial [Paraburkholderia phenoliruptrix]|uniref:hypothetical protein n=1 Tax=Paraburkholderia phenoliruptrix TaxID=252970 RepID=UPI001C2E6054
GSARSRMIATTRTSTVRPPETGKSSCRYRQRQLSPDNPAFVVHLTDESITWVSAQSKATEVWTYVATNHILIYSQQSPRAGTDLSELTPGSGAFGDVMFSTCREGIK